MFHGRVLNRIVYVLHIIVYIVWSIELYIETAFQELLKKDHSFTINHRNIQSLAIELYRLKENLSNEIMSSIFPPRFIKYNLRTQSDFLRNSVKSSNYGLNSI